jgi:hypothetical protein
LLTADGLQLPYGFIGNNAKFLVGNGMVLVSPHARLDHKRLAQGSRNEHEEYEEGVSGVSCVAPFLCLSDTLKVYLDKLVNENKQKMDSPTASTNYKVSQLRV